jgi:hypothetical protein
MKATILFRLERMMRLKIKSRKSLIIKTESDALVFEFTSIGPKGKIPKLVIYSETNIENVYNLGFGDKDLDSGEIDDLVITDNKDSQKVLVTVASTLYSFVAKYPNVWVFATGSSKARTRLYQIAISKNLDEIAEDFIVLGKIGKKLFPFEKNSNMNNLRKKRKVSKAPAFRINEDLKKYKNNGHFANKLKIANEMLLEIDMSQLSLFEQKAKSDLSVLIEYKDLKQYENSDAEIQELQVANEPIEEYGKNEAENNVA